MPSPRFACIALLLPIVTGSAAANGVPVEDFAHAPNFAYASLSPNGSHIAYVDQVEARQVVFIRSVENHGAHPTLRVDPRSERIRWCGWADTRYVLCGTTVTQRRQHQLVESTRLHAIDSVKRESRELNSRADSGAARDQVIDLMPARGQFVLLQQDTGGRGFPEVVQLNVATDKAEVVVRSQPPIRSWMSNGRGQVMLGLSYDGQVATVFARNLQGNEWKPVVTQSLTDPDAIGPLAFGVNDNDLYVLRHHKGRAALFRLNLAQPSALALIFADPVYDISGPLVMDPDSGEALAIRYFREGPDIQFFSSEEKEVQRWLDRELPEVSNEIVGRSIDGARLLVVSGSDVDPPSVYVAGLKPRSLRLIGHQFPELESRPLTPMRPTMYLARDGQRIPAYLTEPSGRDAPGPAVVLPHGGPETRDVRKFDPLVQFLAANGYAVLQMNYRGSLGYGAGFAAAGGRQWGGVMHNDITDGARWMVEQQIADPVRMCIVGTSYGGYAALLGAARESQWYACAASFGGLSDLLAFYNSTRRRPDAEMWRERLGDDSRALWQMSPLAFAWRIETPVMLIHGGRDAVVSVSQARRLARVLQKEGKAHELIERAECDHEMTSSACRIGVFRDLARFLNGVLDGS